MAFDFKKEYREFYLPPGRPVSVPVPEMQFAAVAGKGDPNDPDGAYQRAVGALYAVSYALKMSKKGSRTIPGYFDYVVPPLEGLWRQDGDGTGAFDLSRKAEFQWTSMIRLPEFVTQADFDWALETASRKTDCAGVFRKQYSEGLCVQCMHIGPYSTEPETLARIHAFAEENGLAEDISEARPHHEIYLSDPRRTAPEKLKTVLRIPVRNRSET